ncbi:uncharacterized protein Z518_11404 [Rhinocladiella mackenziei CBS 650.93]|uniref:Rhinocladiella mackenziei CBS 650.93 unplaced genomic scaffold supercont1.13, whole genome shotgun sequence n=1 Tax=Rhinocladiella mackenziei CBS 650.93 TaxID=1442369 RepID=A0A0D2FBE2_9EURO|nr:uncharacterized protein Z518_11404 [Rhinocladiella mackenziei CBS 650.93]KIW99416.1 hypothetical protein Z518_11404 [Rhinocladiella mackenziei CBS 650.93]
MPKSSDTSGPSRDPRRRTRTTSYNNAEPAMTLNRGAERDNSGANTPRKNQSTNDEIAASTLSDFGDLPKSILTLLSNVIDSALAKRKTSYLETEAKTAQAEYDRSQKTSAQFPIVIEQAFQRKKKIDSICESAKTELRASRAAENISAQDLVRLLVDAVARDTQRLLTTQISTLQRDLDNLRSQHDSKNEGTDLAASRIANLVAENERIRTHLNVLQDKMKQMEEELRELRSVRRSDIGTSDALVDELRKETAEQVQKVRNEFKSLDELPDRLDRLHKSTYLKEETIRNRCQAVETNLATLLKETSQDMAEQAALRSQLSDIQYGLERVKTSSADLQVGTNTLRNEVGNLQKSSEAQSDKVHTLQRFLEKQHEELQSFESALAGAKSEMSKSFASHTDAAANALASRMDDKFEKFTTEVDRANNARDALIVEDIKRTERDLRAKFESIQQQLMEVEKGSKSRLDVPQLSNEHLQTLESAAALVPRIRELESQLETLRKGLEKQVHLSQWQSHRFDNLTSETLARQMIGVVAPTLPKFEQGLGKVEAEVQNLRSRLEQPSHMAEEFTAEQDERLRALEENIDGARTHARSNYDSLVREFRKTRDNIVNDIKKLQMSHTRSIKNYSKYHASTNKKLDEIETYLEDLRPQLGKSSSAEAVSPTSTEWAALVSKRTLQTTPDRLKPKASNRSRRKTSFLSHESNGSITGHHSSHKSDVVNAEEEGSVLIQMFQKPRQSEDTVRPPAKRRRSGSPEVDNLSTVESDDSVRAPQRRRERRP